MGFPATPAWAGRPAIVRPPRRRPRHELDQRNRRRASLRRRGGGTAGRARRRPGVGTVYRWELRKLRYQKRTYLGLGAAALVPILFVVAVQFRHHRAGGGDFAFASYLTKSGLVFPLVILLFGAIWLFPLITALVAGDIFASEDHNGTLKTVLTRSLERWQIFTGKALTALTYAIVAI